MFLFIVVWHVVVDACQATAGDGVVDIVGAVGGEEESGVVSFEGSEEGGDDGVLFEVDAAFADVDVGFVE